MFLGDSPEKRKKSNDNKNRLTFSLYPDPGSNRDGLPHWCLRPARLPIPPSGRISLDCECKGRRFFYICKTLAGFFLIPALFYENRLMEAGRAAYATDDVDARMEWNP